MCVLPDEVDILARLVRGGYSPAWDTLRCVGVLVLVRHGQATLGTGSYDALSELGRRQAAAVGARLRAADLEVTRVVCGSLTRQRDTALAILAALGIPESQLHADDRLDEYDHVSVFDAHSSDVTFETARGQVSPRELQSALDEAILRWIAADGEYTESHDAFVSRVEAVLGELTAAPGVTVAATSSGVIALACTQLLGLSAERWPDLARIVVNGSITKLISGRRGTHLLTFNDHAHFERDRAELTYR
jgi:broad specificity phosphatase PhoE